MRYAPDETAPGGRGSVARVALFAALAGLVAMLVPPGMIPATASALLVVAASHSALQGVFAPTPIFARHFTRWDEAATLVLLGIGADFAAAALSAPAAA